jgi:tetratricopeptide (TPR) repeat protein
MPIRRTAAATLAAVVVATGCLVSKPDPAVVEAEAGDGLLSKSEFGPAAEAYQRALALDPKQEETWAKLAHAYIRLGDRDKAAAALHRKADLQVDPAKKAEVLRQVAGIYLQSQERDKGEPALLEVLKLAPSDEETLTWLAELAADRGGARSNAAAAQPEQLDLALRYYDQLIALRPEAQSGYVHKRIVLTKYLSHLALQKQAAEQSLGRKRGAEVAETRDRIAQLKARIAELEPALDAASRKLAELRPKKPAN